MAITKAYIEENQRRAWKLLPDGIRIKDGFTYSYTVRVSYDGGFSKRYRSGLTQDEALALLDTIVVEPSGHGA